MDLALSGRVVIITGGTDGLGAALASLLMEEGARVAVCGRDAERLVATRRWLGDAALVVRADVTDPDEIGHLVEAAIERWGQIDGLVNNAGRSAAHRIEAVDDEAWLRDLDLKVVAAARLTRLCLPYLRASDAAAIVNVLNTGAKAPTARSLPTTASRAAGLAMTKALSKELGPSGVRVNAVLIGLVESGQWRRLSETSGRPLDEIYRGMATDIPLGRVGRAREFADLAAYLLSPRSSFVTGAGINLDGGASPAV